MVLGVPVRMSTTKSHAFLQNPMGPKSSVCTEDQRHFWDSVLTIPILNVSRWRSHSDSYLRYKVGKIVNNTLELNVDTCEAEVVAGGNNFFYGSFTHIKEKSFDPVCGTQSELGKFTIKHYATNLTKEVIFDPLGNSGANTIILGVV